MHQCIETNILRRETKIAPVSWKEQLTEWISYNKIKEPQFTFAPNNRLPYEGIFCIHINASF
jgi:hypothetical protein